MTQKTFIWMFIGISVLHFYGGCDDPPPIQSSPIIDKPTFRSQTGTPLTSLTIIDTTLLSTRFVPLKNKPIPRLPHTHLLYNTQIASAKSLTQLWTKLDHNPKIVPNISVESFPSDMQTLKIPEKKKAFFRTLLPHILSHNKTINDRRTRLQKIKTKQQQLSPSDRSFVKHMAKQYRLETAPTTLSTLSDTLSALLIRADTVPPSLALAQAAIESGWATSRFAREGNNLYGQRVIAGEAPGLAAKKQKKAWFKVAIFPTMGASLRSYVRNLNTHPAYHKFRQIRQNLRTSKKTQDPTVLAQGLEKYSTRGQKYIADVNRIMRQNKLIEYDQFKLLPLQLPNR